MRSTDRSDRPVGVLLLAIRPGFADRILDGAKHFELRKRLPRRAFDRVYMYVSGGGGIVGSFDVRDAFTLPLGALWDRVGERGTSLERFYAYYRGLERGSAIEIARPVRFERPLQLPELKKLIPKFNAPQSFLYLESGSPLYNELERLRFEAIRKRGLELRPIRRSEGILFQKLVTAEIGKRYDDVGPGFARHLLRTSANTHDPDGIFTTSKEVLAVENARHTVIGFTVLTYKLGHSVKSGPTILLPQYRNRGLGQMTRSAIEARVRAAGRRKVYCTIPDNEPALYKHFISAGFRVEGHLSAHYQAERGELVLGKVLRHRLLPAVRKQRLRSVAGRAVPLSRDIATQCARFIEGAFPNEWMPSPVGFGKKITLAALRKNVKTYEKKPIDVWCLVAKEEIVASIVLIHKRGGATKGLLLSRTRHSASVAKMVNACEHELKDRGRRKMYFIVPISNVSNQELLTSIGYEIEAVLREPYTPGEDVFVLSRFL